MEILKVNVVGYYYYNPRIELKKYNGSDPENKNKDVKCAICLKSIYDPSYETISNNVNIMFETKIELGKCGHLFHSDCIKNWLKTNTICPIDKVAWCRHRTIDNQSKFCYKNKKYINNKYVNNKFQEKEEIIKKFQEKEDKIEIFEDEELIEEVYSDIEDDE